MPIMPFLVAHTNAIYPANVYGLGVVVVVAVKGENYLLHVVCLKFSNSISDILLRTWLPFDLLELNLLESQVVVQ